MGSGIAKITEYQAIEQGSNAGKEYKMSKKEKFALYLPPEKKVEIERIYQEDGSRSITVFIEHAIDFYLSYLKADTAGIFLPTALKSYMDGRLGTFEKRMSSVLFKNAVETDMAMSILADNADLDEEYLRRQRNRSVNNVKRTNGQLSFEQLARQAAESGDGEWLD
jgi:hypothetical protein